MKYLLPTFFCINSSFAFSLPSIKTMNNTMNTNIGGTPVTFWQVLKVGQTYTPPKEEMGTFASPEPPKSELKNVNRRSIASE